MDQIKIKLLSELHVVLENKVEDLRSILTSIIESKLNETKSSAGDKFETGRAMLQREEDMKQSQLNLTLQMIAKLKQINFSIQSKIIQEGHLVETSNGKYLLSVGLGKIKLDSDVYYAISTMSPIGKELVGKKKGESFNFNKLEIKVNALI